MNIINRAFQEFAQAGNRLFSQEPRIRCGRLMKGIGAVISASAITQHKGALDFLGLQGLAISLAATGALIENPAEFLETIERLGISLALSTYWI